MENLVAKMLVSVIIPCYNQAHFLSEAMASVSSQAFDGEIEVIVVDDGSSDETSTVAGRHKISRLIRQANRGLSAARNKGLADSTGDYVIFLDADDRLLPEAVNAGLSALVARPNAAFAWGCSSSIDQNGTPIDTPVIPPMDTDPYRALFKDNFIATPGCVTFRREFLERLGGFDETLRNGCEDIDLYLRIAGRWPIVCSDETVLQYRKHSRSMSLNMARMITGSHELYLKHRPDIAGDIELEEVCRRNIRPKWYLTMINLPLIRSRNIFRLIAAIRLRTRFRSVWSSLRRLAGQVEY